MHGPLSKAIFACLVLAGCSGQPLLPKLTSSSASALTETVDLTEPQSCAIGYDLARTIYENLPAGRSDIIVREGQGACERHAIEYLRRSGFAIRKTGGAPFVVETRAMGPNIVLAVGRIGTRHTVSRLYELAAGGVYGAGPASFQKIVSQSVSPRPRRRNRVATSPALEKGDL